MVEVGLELALQWIHGQLGLVLCDQFGVGTVFAN